MTREKILQHLHQLLIERPEIVFAYLHGSFVDGPAYNDIDVALFLNPPPADPFDYEMSASVELTRALHLPIDIQVINNAPLGFQHQVLQGELFFAQDEIQLTNFIEYVANEYTAFSHYLPDYLEAVTT
ncbi:MAG TPA: nucleotidyltransferase domain-containing protein [Anaerolineae bacterium]|nr:nucleotidyltransferase domain-containing protein [Anaerolineae bacterium]